MIAHWLDARSLFNQKLTVVARKETRHRPPHTILRSIPPRTLPNTLDDRSRRNPFFCLFPSYAVP